MILLFALVFTGVISVLPAHIEHQKVRDEVAKAKLRLHENKKQEHELRAHIEDLCSNPKVVARIARDKFGLCRRGERVYRFVDEDLHPDNQKKEF